MYIREIEREQCVQSDEEKHVVKNNTVNPIVIQLSQAESVLFLALLGKSPRIVQLCISV